MWIAVYRATVTRAIEHLKCDIKYSNSNNKITSSSSIGLLECERFQMLLERVKCFVLLNSSGRLFQALGPAQANARSANDEVIIGTSRSPLEADLRRRLDSDSATGLHSSIKYSGALLWIVLYVRRHSL